MKITRAFLTELTDREDDIGMHAIGRALVHLLKRQTEAEAKLNTTSVHNERGFTPADARQGSICAKYYIKHGKLEDWQVKKWRERNAKGISRIAKYWAQLNEEAQKKEMRQMAKEG